MRRVLPLALVLITACLSPQDAAFPDGTGEAFVLVVMSRDESAVFLAPSGMSIPVATPAQIDEVFYIDYPTWAAGGFNAVTQPIELPVVDEDSGRPLVLTDVTVWTTEEREPTSRDWDEAEKPYVGLAPVRIAVDCGEGIETFGLAGMAANGCTDAGTPSGMPAIVTERPPPRRLLDFDCGEWSKHEPTGGCEPPGPPRSDCGPDEVDFHPFGNCAPVGQCPAGKFPSTTDPNAVYVGSGGVAQIGTIDDPFRTIPDGLGAGGSTVVVAGGRYVGNVVVPNDVTVIGACAGRTIIEGTVSAELDATAVVEGVSITSPASAIRAGRGTLAVRESWVVGSGGGAAIVVHDGASLTLDEVVIRTTDPVATAGVSVEGGGTLTARTVDVESAANAVDSYVVNVLPNGSATLSGVAIRSGGAIAVQSHGMLLMTDTDLLQPSPAGPSVNLFAGAANLGKTFVRRHEGAAIMTSIGVVVSDLVVEGLGGDAVAIAAAGNTTTVMATGLRTEGAALLRAAGGATVIGNNWIARESPSPAIGVLASVTLDNVDVDGPNQAIDIGTGSLTMTGFKLRSTDDVVIDTDSSPSVILRDGEVRSDSSAALMGRNSKVTLDRVLINSNGITVDYAEGNFEARTSWVDGAIRTAATNVAIAGSIITPTGSEAVAFEATNESETVFALTNVFFDLTANGDKDGLWIHSGKVDLDHVQTNGEMGTAVRITGPASLSIDALNVFRADVGLDVAAEVGAWDLDNTVITRATTAVHVAGELTIGRASIVESDRAIVADLTPSIEIETALTIYDTDCGLEGAVDWEMGADERVRLVNVEKSECAP